MSICIRITFFQLIIMALASWASLASAQQDLPKVLILGDQVYQQPAAEIKKTLKDKADVVFVRIEAGEVRNTQTALNNLTAWLGEKEWDLIHFNFGLGDLVHRAPNMKSFRVMAKEAGGVMATSPTDYAKNLRAIVARLKKTNAKLIWASTTPIRHSASNVFLKGSEVEYNRIAQKIMEEFEVPVNDMYTSVKDLINMDRPAAHGADPFFFDRQPIHLSIIEMICGELGLESGLNRNEATR